MKTCIIDLCTDDEEVINSIDYNSFKYGEYGEYMHNIDKIFKIRKITSYKKRYWIVETNIENNFDMLDISYKFVTKEYISKFRGDLFSFDCILNTKENRYKDIKKYAKRFIVINNILNDNN